jgi:hypothetical protein
MLIRLREVMDDEDGWGRAQGRKTHDRLLATIEANPSERVFQISHGGVSRVDASFARESVLELARRFRRRRGLCLVDVVDDDSRENWDAAALRVEQPITLWQGERAQILGPQPTEGTRAVLEHLLAVPNATASDCVAKFGMQIANSSNKLKYLFENGYVLRTERPSGSGGIEHVYYRIR